MGLARHAAWRTALVIGALLVALSLPAASPAATSYPDRDHLRTRPRGRELLDHPAAPGDLRHARSTRPNWRPTARPSARSARRAGGGSGPLLHRRPLLESGNGCAGDIRLEDWAANGYGIVRPVLFTARDDATLSDQVWAMVRDPAKRPAIVITNGSVQADEQLYWYAAQTLAKDGYVVLTFDPQGQGQRDTLGASPDETRGCPGRRRRPPFYDGTEDAHRLLPLHPKHPV